MNRTVAMLVLPCLLVVQAGCIVGHFVGGAMQNEEYQKKIEVPARYNGLQDQSVAILVDADYALMYQHQDLVSVITRGVTQEIYENVGVTKLYRPAEIVKWQLTTPQWNALSFTEMADQLRVTRIIYVDLYEFRLNPPGNRWEWQGVCAADVNIIERDGFDPDSYADTYHISVEFPTIKGVGAESESAAAIKTGLVNKFIQHTSWLFYTHKEPKYPDKYRPELDI